MLKAGRGKAQLSIFISKGDLHLLAAPFSSANCQERQMPMQTLNFIRKNSRKSLIPLFGICLFLLLYIVAALLYPGSDHEYPQPRRFCGIPGPVAKLALYGECDCNGNREIKIDS